MATKAYKIPGADVEIEEGTKVFISADGVQHDPEHYPFPQVFDPDRFSNENLLKRHPFCFLSFGEGPRSCIGRLDSKFFQPPFVSAVYTELRLRFLCFSQEYG